MYNSLKENLSSLKSAFANSADFTVRDMILNSDNKTTSAVITIEGMCSKEVIALSGGYAASAGTGTAIGAAAVTAAALGG